jgi:hypothetical protein
MARSAGARWLGAVVAVTACDVATLARADERFSLAWEAPPECPGNTRVVEAVRAWLDQPHAGPAAQAVRVEATVRPSAGGWELELTLAAPGGSEHQTLVAARCETLVQVVALKVALAVDPTAVLRSLEGARASAPPAAGPALAIRGALGAGLGPLPGASAFASLAGSVELPGWLIEVAGTAWLPRSVSYPELPSVGANLTLATGSVSGCLLPAMGPVDFPICAGAELGIMAGSGFGVAEVATSSQVWAAAVLGPAFRWALGSSVSLWIGAEAAIGIARPEFHMRNLELLYRPDAITARTWAGFEIRL